MMQAERSVETFKQVMRCLLVERHINETDWVTLVQEVTIPCISYTNANTSYSSHEVMYGVHLRLRVDTIFPYNRPIDFPDLQTYCRYAEEARKEVNAKVNDNMLNSQQSMELIFIRRAKSCQIDLEIQECNQDSQSEEAEAYNTRRQLPHFNGNNARSLKKRGGDCLLCLNASYAPEIESG